MNTPKSPPRKTARYPFTAKVALTAPGSSVRVAGLTTDLSEGGCGVRAQEVFPRGSRVHLEITKNSQSLHVPATVVYGLPPNVMGLSFGELTPDQRATLNSWIEQAIPTLRRMVEERENSAPEGRVPAGKSDDEKLEE